MVDGLAHLPHQLDTGVADGDVDRLREQDHLLQHFSQGWVVLTGRCRKNSYDHTKTDVEIWLVEINMDLSEEQTSTDLTRRITTSRLQERVYMCIT